MSGFLAGFRAFVLGDFNTLGSVCWGIAWFHFTRFTFGGFRIVVGGFVREILLVCEIWGV